MPYYSARDISGLFQLNYDPIFLKGKSLIKLELFQDINFADPITYYDYEIFRSKFYRENRWKDRYMDFSEERNIPGFIKYNLVNLGKGEPCFLSLGWFILLTILSFGEIYKCYFNSLCVNQGFL